MQIELLFLPPALSFVIFVWDLAALEHGPCNLICMYNGFWEKAPRVEPPRTNNTNIPFLCHASCSQHPAP